LEEEEALAEDCIGSGEGTFRSEIPRPGRSDRLQGCDAAIETLAQGNKTVLPDNDEKAKERSESRKKVKRSF